MPLELDERDRRLLRGAEGDGAALAMRILTRMAEVSGARRLIDVTSAHVDGCLYHGEAGLDFAERLVAGGARVSVPTTLNVGSLDLLHPHLFRGDATTRERARRLMDCYVALGCEPTWTCAPYQLARRPAFGDQIAWAESNAIVFANSVLGARTNRYGDFVDACAAIAGRVPDSGLHRTQARRGQALFRLVDVPRRLLAADALYPVLGHLVGQETGTLIPVLDGLPASTTEDQLKALGAAAASSGSVGLFHAVGVTPEAPTLEAAFGGTPPLTTVDVTAARLRRARDALTTTGDGALGAVSVGTPHFSVREFEILVGLLAHAPRVRATVDFYVSTGRDVLAEVERRGWGGALEAAGVEVVVDTCTYVTPVLRKTDGAVMTNSAKWAYYAPGNLGVDVVFGSLEECVRSAVAGRVWRDPRLWADDR
ncbi:MAG: aconitase X catalytic domain-containing protein [Actinobacteria bacterium]|nr:aconitase X catalytic domain-containing protein [Actinomycetota bacterium]